MKFLTIANYFFRGNLVTQANGTRRIVECWNTPIGAGFYRTHGLVLISERSSSAGRGNVYVVVVV